MVYKRSAHRLRFEEEVGSLAQRAKAAQKLSGEHSALRDMVYQCAIFRTSASVETYIRLIIESWFHSLRTLSRGDRVPHPARSYLASQKLQKSFQSFFFNKDEQVLISSFVHHTPVWHMLLGEAQLPSYFDGREIHNSVAYPSFKNLKRLFYRIGINDFDARVGKILKRDVETLIEGFQSFRTALAHASPPDVTYRDVKRLLDDMMKFIGAVDRTLFIHVLNHGGVECWPC